MAVFQVDRSLVEYLPKNSNYRKMRKLQYGDLDYDEDGWVDATKFYPSDCDLVVLQTDKGKVLKGWRSGLCWEGLRLKDKDKIVKWKRVLHDY